MPQMKIKICKNFKILKHSNRGNITSFDSFTGEGIYRLLPYTDISNVSSIKLHDDFIFIATGSKGKDSNKATLNIEIS